MMNLLFKAENLMNSAEVLEHNNAMRAAQMAQAYATIEIAEQLRKLNDRLESWDAEVLPPELHALRTAEWNNE